MVLVVDAGARCQQHARRAAHRAEKAVSYTHLRAHETVLDLVCRLLLEKKKNYHRACVNDEHQQSNINMYRTDLHDHAADK